MFKAFNLENHVKSPNQEFDCEEFRFTHRFCPFQYFTTPQLVHYYQFKERDERFGTSYDVKAIYNFATSNYDAARAIYEKHSEHQKVWKLYFLLFYVSILIFIDPLVGQDIQN